VLVGFPILCTPPCIDIGKVVASRPLARDRIGLNDKTEVGQHLFSDQSTSTDIQPPCESGEAMKYEQCYGRPKPGETIHARRAAGVR
jgi:hypothetical protein